MTAYKIALAAAVGSAASWSKGLGTFALAAGGGVAIGIVLGAVIAFIRYRLNDPLVKSARTRRTVRHLSDRRGSAAVLATVIVVRIAWVYMFAYLPRMLSPRVREREPAPTAAQVFVVAWAGMRGVVSLAAAFAVPMTTLSSAPFPGRPNIVFLTFVVVIGTLLLHGLPLPWLIRRLVTGVVILEITSGRARNGTRASRR